MKCVHGVSMRLSCVQCFSDAMKDFRRNNPVPVATREQKKEFWGTAHYVVDKTVKTR